MPEQFPGTWYLLIDLGKQGLQKIKLQEVRTREAALIAAKILYRKAVQNHGIQEEDGVTYPKPPRIVYAEDVVGTIPRDITADQYPLTVDYSLTLKQAIAQCQFRYVSPRIASDHFPPTRTGKEKITLALVHMNRVATTAEILADLEENNLRPATIDELLALGKKHPDLQLEFPIIALGSGWQEPVCGRNVPYLYRFDGGRDLSLHRDVPASQWSGQYRFAAVSK